MRSRAFGATGLTVSEIGFGCARLGGVFQSTTRADNVRTLQRALDAGITFFDTSDMYCQGESEALLGQAMRGRRAQVVLASKVGYCLPAQRQLVARVKPLVRPVIQRLGIKREHLPSTVRGSLSQDFSGAYIVQAVERSLKRLQTDYLDLYQLHSPPREVLESGEFLTPLEQLKREGKVRFFGVSCETTDDAAFCLRYPEISSLQIRLSLLDQIALDVVVPRARERGVALIARECFAGGLLTKRPDALDLETFIADPIERDALRKEMFAYQALAEQWRRPLSEIALQFVLAAHGVSVALTGIRTDAQLDGNLRFAEAQPLSEQQIEALREQRAA
jgi:aryl-alcohol dehydrogenase-like predicted oxidoreductase